VQLSRPCAPNNMMTCSLFLRQVFSWLGTFFLLPLPNWLFIGCNFHTSQVGGCPRWLCCLLTSLAKSQSFGQAWVCLLLWSAQTYLLCFVLEYSLAPGFYRGLGSASWGVMGAHTHVSHLWWLAPWENLVFFWAPLWFPLSNAAAKSDRLVFLSNSSKGKIAPVVRFSFIDSQRGWSWKMGLAH
jgi:hypothetical protein